MNKGDKLREAALKRVEAMDAEYLSPTERANLVNTFIFNVLGFSDPKDVLENPRFWDLVCYASQILAVAGMKSGKGDLLDMSVMISNYIHSLHYSLPEDSPALGPGRESHAKLWQVGENG